MSEADGNALTTQGKPKGAHPTGRFADVQLRNLKTPGVYADGQGLYVRVDPTGTKRWFLRIMIGGNRHDLGLGGYPMIGLSEARIKARELRKLAKSDPNAISQRRKARDGAVTFKKIAFEVHAANAGQWKNPKHAAQWLTTLETYAFPKLGDRPIDAIEQKDCVNVLAPIWTAKPETARRVRQRLKMVFDWAKAHGHRSGDNPLGGIEHGLPKQNDEVEHHAALPYAKIPDFMRSLNASAASVSGRLALEWLILTATRESETRKAAWSEIDLAARLWTIPAERMKAGVEHVVPLSDRTIAVLTEARAAHPESELVFPGQKAKPLSENTLAKLSREMGFGHITAHGFRSSFRDWGAEETQFPNEVLEMALAHTVANKVEAAYRRGGLLDKRRPLMAAWADFAGGVTIPANVVEFKRA
jgi:integrase